MNQLERKVDLQVSAHSGQEDLDLDRVGDDDTQEVVGVPGLGDGRAGQVRFIAYLGNDESLFSTLPVSALNSEVVRQMARLGSIFPTTLYRGIGIRTHVSQLSCTRLRPLKDAHLTELQRRSQRIRTG